MTKPFSLIVTDTSPLFTLVLAGALDATRKPKRSFCSRTAT